MLVSSRLFSFSPSATQHTCAMWHKSHCDSEVVPSTPTCSDYVCMYASGSVFTPYPLHPPLPHPISSSLLISCSPLPPPLPPPTPPPPLSSLSTADFCSRSPRNAISKWPARLRRGVQPSSVQRCCNWAACSRRSAPALLPSDGRFDALRRKRARPPSALARPLAKKRGCCG